MLPSTLPSPPSLPSLPLVRYDSRVKAMELDERPTEQYSDIGGLDKQIEEVRHIPQTLSVYIVAACAMYPYSLVFPSV